MGFNAIKVNAPIILVVGATAVQAVPESLTGRQRFVRQVIIRFPDSNPNGVSMGDENIGGADAPWDAGSSVGFNGTDDSPIDLASFWFAGDGAGPAIVAIETIG